jgi:hypothetical protein
MHDPLRPRSPISQNSRQRVRRKCRTLRSARFRAAVSVSPSIAMNLSSCGTNTQANRVFLSNATLSCFSQYETIWKVSRWTWFEMLWYQKDRHCISPGRDELSSRTREFSPADQCFQTHIPIHCTHIPIHCIASQLQQGQSAARLREKYPTLTDETIRLAPICSAAHPCGGPRKRPCPV